MASRGGLSRSAKKQVDYDENGMTSGEDNSFEKSLDEDGNHSLTEIKKRKSADSDDEEVIPKRPKTGGKREGEVPSKTISQVSSKRGRKTVKEYEDELMDNLDAEMAASHSTQDDQQMATILNSRTSLEAGQILEFTWRISCAIRSLL